MNNITKGDVCVGKDGKIVQLIERSGDMNYNVGGTRNDFMYQAALYTIREAESEAREQGKRIYLVVMSAWMYEVISEHIKTMYNLKIIGKSDKKYLPIMGYDVKVIGDLEYSEPIQFILGRGI